MERRPALHRLVAGLHKRLQMAMATDSAINLLATLPLFEITRVLVRFDHIAVLIVNADNRIM